MAAFGSAIGGGDAIKQAMARRGFSGSPLATQESPTAPGFNPNMVTPQVEGSAGGPPPQGQPVPQGGAPAPQAPPPTMTAMGPMDQSNDTLIIKALAAKLNRKMP